MTTLICGSMAYDAIFEYEGLFSQANLNSSTSKLNASFLASKMHRLFGGCAGNIAYGLNMLGSKPKIIATMGEDAGDYINYLHNLNISSEYIHIVKEAFTVQLMIINDAEQNQINTFYPGAMACSHLNTIFLQDLSKYKLAIISPDGKQGMLNHIENFHKNDIQIIFDPGQALNLFNKQELIYAINCSQYVIVNEYEYELLMQKTNKNIQDFLPNLKAFIITLADKGASLYNNNYPNGLVIKGFTADSIKDATGCGDAFRAGFIYGLEQNYSLEESITLGNKMGANKISYIGGQGYKKLNF